MNHSRSAILGGILLVLAAIFSAMPSALAQDGRTTASEVVDRETLKAYVLSARDYIVSITDINKLASLADELRVKDGDWNSGNMYLNIFLPDGILWFHGDNPELDGTDVRDLEDDNGVKVVQEMLAAAASMEDGDFVEYTWDDPSDPNDENPKVSYAVGYTSIFAQTDFILVGGFYQDISGVENIIDEFPDPPAITASEVVDRETLKAFVKGAQAWTLEAMEEFGLDLVKLTDELRREGGPWRQGSTYLFTMTEEGFVFFHAARPDQQGKIQVERQDRNGFKFVKALIDAAVAGGGYVEYYWDDPSVEGDEDVGSAKVGYAEAFQVPDNSPVYAGQTLIIGSGFYKGNQMALDFAQFANGDGIISDVVLVNAAGKPVLPAIYFYEKGGDLMDPESVVDVMGDLGTTDYGALTLQSELPPLGELTISTHGRGDLVTGSMKVVSDGPDSPIGGVLRWDLPHIGVAGVGASQPVRGAIFPVRSQEGGIRTGVALRNLSESELMLTCHLMKGGEMMEEQEFTLPANGQDSMFVYEMFESDTSDFTGSVHCTAPPGEQEFTGVAVELDAANRIFTTLPMVPVEREATSQEESPAQLAPANEAAFNELFVGMRLEGTVTTLSTTITVDFVSTGRLSETSPLGAKMGSYTYENTGPNTGTFTSTYDDASQCTTDLTFDSTTTGMAVANCPGNVLAPVVSFQWRLIEIP